MKYSVLLSICTLVFGLSLQAEERTILRTADAIEHPSMAAVAARAPFEAEGNVCFARRSNNSILVRLLQGGSAYICCPTNLTAESFLGCRVRVTGHLEPESAESGHAQGTNITILGRFPIPETLELDADSLLSGKHVGRIARLRGLVCDIRMDDIDPGWTIVTIVSEGKTFGCCLLENLMPHIRDYLGAEVTVTGLCSWLARGCRHYMGPALFLSDHEAIEVNRKPPQDPFSAPDIGSITNVTPHNIAALGRRCVTGRVLASWGRNKMLLETESDDISLITLDEGPLPVCGETIDASGFPETDLYHLNLGHAVWRKSAQPSAKAERPPVNLTAERILVDDAGRKRIRFLYHGMPVRLTGTVVSLPVTENDDGVMILRDGPFAVPVDTSSCPKALSGVSVGCRIAVSGICRINTIPPTTVGLIPGINGFTLLVRRTDDVEILTKPSWWTPARLLLVIGVLLAGLVVILIWNLMLRKLAERRGKELAKESLARTEANLRVYERTRLAVELHDTLVQNMTGVAIALRTRNYDLAAKTLDFCRKDLRNCLWDLRNLTLDDEDINAAIRKTLTPHAADAELHVRFNVPREKFTDNTAHAILCILRELTINAIRHGEATAIWIAGSTEGDQLLFSVRDNGHGFDPDAAPGMEQGHFGLQGIRDRVEGFEGTLTVESSHSGTKVTIALRMSQMEGIELK